MTPEELEKEIRDGEAGPVYYLYGDEPYLVERGAIRLMERLVSPDFRDFNLTIFYGGEAKGESIAEAAQTLPMFAERRVVLVRRSGGLSAAALDILTEYLQAPSPSTCLIFQGDKIDQRKKFFVELKKSGKLVEYKRPYENQLGSFIREEAASRGKRAEPAAVEMLAYLVGNNLRDLSTQIEKVALFVGERSSITVDDIREAVSDTKVDSVFDLANALGEKNLASSLRSLQTLLRDGEAPLMVLAMVTRHFRQLWRVRDLSAKKMSSQEISKAAGIHPYFVRGIIEQSRGWTMPELRGVFESFYATDLGLKTSGGKPVDLMERLMLEICTRRQR